MSCKDYNYKSCKIIIKKWEKEFIRKENRTPNKDDIRGAPNDVKEAHKQYCLMKTAKLEELILNDCIAEEGFVKPCVDKATHKPLTEKLIATENNDTNIQANTKISNTPNVSDVSNDDSSNTNFQINIDDTKINVNKNTVWGDHLKKNVEKDKKSKIERSTSFEFTQKLFAGKKFKKINHRKSTNRTISKTESTSANVSPTELKSKEIDCASSVSEKNNRECSHLFDKLDIDNSISNLINVSTGKSLTRSNPICIRHDSDSISAIKTKTLDKGWLTRCQDKCSFDNTTVNEKIESTTIQEDQLRNDSNDNGNKTIIDNVNMSIDAFVSIEKNKLHVFPSKTTEKNSDINYSSDEDYVVSSDEENLGKISKNEILPKETKKLTKREKDICDGKEETILSKKTEPYVNKNSIAKINPTMRLGNEHLHEIVKKSNTDGNNSITASNSSAIKLERLVSKVKCGTANDNFVKINIKKKKYSRGKNVMSYTNYKKKQWKSKKQTLQNHGDWEDNFERPINCKNNLNDSIDLDSNHEMDSILPTLSEAANAKQINNDMENNVSHGEENKKEIYDEGYAERIPPLYEYNFDGSEIPNEVTDALYDFGYADFRPGQAKTVMRILSGKSTLLISGTGSGKSLCYQLPAYLYAKRYNCITLVISPLVSLMEDQMMNFPKVLKAACIHTNQTPQMRENVMHKIENNEISVLLISPEAAVNENGFLGHSFSKCLPSIAFVCIDEAHCVSQWSHNFRTSYLILCKVLKERYRINTFLGLTATASKSTISSVIEHLGIVDPDSGVLHHNILPDNLILSVSKDDNRDKALFELLQTTPFVDFKSLIIYCMRRNECERVATFLRTSLQSVQLQTNYAKKTRISLDVEVYHAGLTAARRKTIQKNFMTGKLRIVVATVAFGMGINKSDIRCVIHYNMPRTFEHYVQEIGRAGRDWEIARCHLFYNDKGADIPELKRHIYCNSVDRWMLRNLLDVLFIQCSCDGVCRKHEIAFSVDKFVGELDIPEENITTLLCYVESVIENQIQVLPLTYAKCTIVSYHGIKGFERAAQKCPTLANALADYCQKKQTSIVNSKIEFSVVELADKLGLESRHVKSELKRCEWTRENEKWMKTGIGVTFSELSFHVRSVGNLPIELHDSTLANLLSQVSSIEYKAIRQLEECDKAFRIAAFDNVNEMHDAEEIYKRHNQLRNSVLNYFEENNDCLCLHIPAMARPALENEATIVDKVRDLKSKYPEQNFSARSIAKIFHGIESPNFSALQWARTPFWRCALQDDFNLVLSIIRREMV